MLKAWKNAYEKRSASESAATEIGKDCVVEDVRKAIKLLLQFGFSEKCVKSDCWVGHDLCLRLDEALRHGLRRPSGGYWPYVRIFTHANIVSLLEHTNTKLDTGRAWLHHSLNEGSLESYIQILCCDNSATIGKFYKPHSLLRDDTRRQIFLGFLSSLRHVHFQLDLEWPESGEARGVTPLPSPEDSGVALLDSDLSEPLDSLQDDQEEDSATLNELEDNRINGLLSLEFEVPSVCCKMPSEKKRVSFHESDDCCKKSDTLSDLCGDDNTLCGERGAPEGQEDDNFQERPPSLTRAEILKIRRKQVLKKKVKSLVYCPGVRANKESCDELLQELAQEMATNKRQQHQTGVDLTVKDVTLNIIRNDVFYDQSEHIYKVFKARGPLCQPAISPLTIVLTNQAIYVVSLVNNEFLCHFQELYQNFKAASLGPGGETISLVGSESVMVAMDTAYDLISHIELAMRKLKLALPLWRFLEVQDIKLLWRSLAQKVPTLQGEGLCCVVHVEADTKVVESAASKEGLLMMRIGAAGPWLPAFLALRESELWVFRDELERDPQLVVSLARCQGCHRSPVPERPHTFEIICGRGAAPLQLAAADEYEASDWLQALLQSVSGPSPWQRSSNKLKLCGLVMTSQHLITYSLDQELAQLLCCAEIVHLNALRVANTPSNWCVLEFECSEAEDSDGDWTVYFSSDAARARFCAELESLWSTLSQLRFPRSDVIPDCLLTRCKEANLYLQTSWDSLLSVGLSSLDD